MVTEIPSSHKYALHTALKYSGNIALFCLFLPLTLSVSTLVFEVDTNPPLPSPWREVLAIFHICAAHDTHDTLYYLAKIISSRLKYFQSENISTFREY